jgi:hypothetical protein
MKFRFRAWLQQIGPFVSSHCFVAAVWEGGAYPKPRSLPSNAATRNGLALVLAQRIDVEQATHRRTPIYRQYGRVVADRKAADVTFNKKLACDAPSEADFDRRLPATLHRLWRRLLEGGGIVVKSQSVVGWLHETIEEFRK